LARQVIALQETFAYRLRDSHNWRAAKELMSDCVARREELRLHFSQEQNDDDTGNNKEGDDEETEEAFMLAEARSKAFLASCENQTFTRRDMDTANIKINEAFVILTRLQERITEATATSDTAAAGGGGGGGGGGKGERGQGLKEDSKHLRRMLKVRVDCYEVDCAVRSCQLRIFSHASDVKSTIDCARDLKKRLTRHYGKVEDGTFDLKALYPLMCLSYAFVRLHHEPKAALSFATTAYSIAASSFGTIQPQVQEIAGLMIKARLECARQATDEEERKVLYLQAFEQAYANLYYYTSKAPLRGEGEDSIKEAEAKRELAEATVLFKQAWPEKMQELITQRSVLRENIDAKALAEQALETAMSHTHHYNFNDPCLADFVRVQLVVLATLCDIEQKSVLADSFEFEELMAISNRWNAMAQQQGEDTLDLAAARLSYAKLLSLAKDETRRETACRQAESAHSTMLRWLGQDHYMTKEALSYCTIGSAE